MTFYAILQSALKMLKISRVPFPPKMMVRQEHLKHHLKDEDVLFLCKMIVVLVRPIIILT